MGGSGHANGSANVGARHSRATTTCSLQRLNNNGVTKPAVERRDACVVADTVSTGRIYQLVTFTLTQARYHLGSFEAVNAFRIRVKLFAFASLRRNDD
jgi:hypothetical protein